jgi:putative iron-only hydrogenase system regulator
MEKRIGTALIMVEDKSSAPAINQILSAHGEIILARQGLSLPERSFSLITLVLEGNTDQLASLSGQVGKLRGVKVKTVLMKSTTEKNENI